MKTRQGLREVLNVFSRRKLKMAEEVSKETVEKAFEAIEIAKSTGKVKKGVNEATKAIERGTAKLVAVAKDVTPPEIVMHMPLIAKDKGIPCVTVDTKEELGSAAGISVGCSAVAVITEGDAKKMIAELKKKLITE
jgi:large subunit ribosomal protein L7Ae